MQCDQSFEKQPTEQTCQHPDMQKEAGFARDPSAAVGRQPTTGNDHVDVGVVRER